jgi:predicted dehydrogenase
MSARKRLSRRGFLKGAAVAAAAAGAPYVLTSSALGGAGGTSASERIVMGFIGTGGRGGGHVRSLSGWRDIQIVAICDVDAYRRDRARQGVADRYARDRRGGRGVAAYTDFRDLVARDEIDAVLIASPDHWHALPSILAARAGKDVYCEKPLCRYIGEGQAVVEAMRRHGRVFQTGSQERSGRARIACEFVRNGRIGKLHTIRTYLPTSRRQTTNHEPQAVPDGFDYDMWLGPAPWAPYHPLRCHGNFRWNRDYAIGELTDRGAHVNDIALWGAGPLLKGPVEIEGTGVFPRDGLWNTAIDYHLEYRYASGLRIITDSQNPDGSHPPRGIKFEGSEGWIFVHIHGARLEAEPISVLQEPIADNEIHLHRSPGHHQDWTDAIRSRGDTVAPAAEGHRTASFCYLGHIAILLGRKVVWDTEKEQFLNDDEANRMVQPIMREPWRI